MVLVLWATQAGREVAMEGLMRFHPVQKQLFLGMTWVGSVSEHNAAYAEDKKTQVTWSYQNTWQMRSSPTGTPTTSRAACSGCEG
jgi:hypothetical protein